MNEMLLNKRDRRVGWDSVPTTTPPAIDAQALLKRCMGSASFAVTLLAELEANGLNHVETIAQHLACGHAEEVAETAHALKGAAGIIAAQPLRSLAAEIEAGGRSGDLDGLGLLVQDLQEEMERCLAQIPEICELVRELGN